MLEKDDGDDEYDKYDDEDEEEGCTRGFGASERPTPEMEGEIGINNGDGA